MAKVITLTQESMSDFIVDKNVPYIRKGLSLKYPFRNMDLKDSFLISKSAEDAQRVRSAASVFGRRNKVKFSILKNEDGEYRCWRVK